MSNSTKFACVKDFQDHAKEFMAPTTYDYVNGQQQQSDDFLDIQLKLRGLANLKNFVDPLSCTIFGQKVSSPIGYGSFPHQGVAILDGELASAQAAASLGQIYCLSSSSTISMEEVAKVSNGPMIFELDMRLPQSVRNDLIVRILRLPQFIAIVVDAAYHSNRQTECEFKHDFELPPYLEAGSLKQYAISNNLRDSYGLLQNKQTCSSLDEIQKIKELSGGKLKVGVKGIMCREDALMALERGADAIWVSNGGGLKPSSAPSSINVLKAISQVRNQYPLCEIFVDSGITRGTDVMKCLAFGANAVFIGRPIIWALQYNGQSGCEELMSIINEELTLAMALTNCFNVKQITEQQVIFKVRAKM